MGYRLRQGLHFCESGDRTVFLDLRSNRYFGLSPANESVFRALRAPQTPGATSDQIAAIKHLDLIEDDPGIENDISATCRDLPRDSRAEHPSHLALSTWMVARAATALFRAEYHSRSRSLERIVMQLQRRKAALPTGAPSGVAIEETVRAFTALGRWVSPRDRCLPRSIAMAQLLLSRSVPVDLVIGVVPRPFRAHCWVEYQGSVLNDRLENVLTYTPILAV